MFSIMYLLDLKTRQFYLLVGIRVSLVEIFTEIFQQMYKSMNIFDQKRCILYLSGNISIQKVHYFRHIYLKDNNNNTKFKYHLILV